VSEHTHEQRQETVRDATALPQTTLANAKANEVPSGYKQTEVGWIPEDWDVCRIEQHAAISTGEKNTQDKIADGRYPFFVRSQNVERINSYSFEGEAVLTAGDGVGTGKIFHYINGRFDVHQRVYRISDFSLSMNGKYFFYQFSNRFYDRIMAMTAKSSVDSVRRDMIAGMSIPLPPLPEQRAIATALSDVDALIDALDRLIAKKRDIKQATMQQLLTGETRLPGFEGEWETRTLAESAECLDNLRVPLNESQRAGMQGDIPYCGANGVLDYVNDYVVDDDVILLAEDGGHFDEYEDRPIAYRMIGKCWVNNHAHILKAKPGYDQGFFFFSLVHKNILPYLASGTRAKLNRSELNKIEVVCPNEIAEQQAIAAVFSDMDAEIEALESRREKTKQIKQGMMQELLTGRVRLIEVNREDASYG